MGVIPATFQVLAYLQRTLVLPRPAHGQAFGEVSGSGRQKTSSHHQRSSLSAGCCARRLGHRSFLAALAAAVSASRSGLPVFRRQRGTANHPVRHRGQT